MKSNLKKFYEKYYSMSPLDLADSAERNRVRAYCILCVFLCSDPILFIFKFFLMRHNLRDGISDFIFLAVCELVNLVAFCLCIRFKDVERKKAYIFKNILVYLVFLFGVNCGTYNFYVQGSIFICIINFFLSILIMLSVFTVSFPFFFIIVMTGFIGIAPEIYRRFNSNEFTYFILITMGMCFLSLFLRYRDKQFIISLKKQKKSLEIKTFGNFTPLYDGNVIKFSRSKSPELLAYLIYKGGSSANTRELISVLYGDHADSASYGANLRLLISDLKHTFAELEVQNFFITEYNNFRINPEVVHCDYYDFLAGDPLSVKTFSGEFMSQYSWAEDKIAFLEKKAFALKA